MVIPKAKHIVMNVTQCSMVNAGDGCYSAGRRSPSRRDSGAGGGGRPPHADRRRCACSAISEMRRGATGKRARAGLRPAGGSRYRAPSRAALPFGGGIPGVGRPAALCVAACLALPALEAW